MIILNLFIAVILEGFDKTQKNENSIITPYMLTDFAD